MIGRDPEVRAARRGGRSGIAAQSLAQPGAGAGGCVTRWSGAVAAVGIGQVDPPVAVVVDAVVALEQRGEPDGLGALGPSIEIVTGLRLVDTAGRAGSPVGLTVTDRRPLRVQHLDLEGPGAIGRNVEVTAPGVQIARSCWTSPVSSVPVSQDRIDAVLAAAHGRAHWPMPSTRKFQLSR